MAHHWHPVAHHPAEWDARSRGAVLRLFWRGAVAAYIYLCRHPNLLHAGSP